MPEENCLYMGVGKIPGLQTFSRNCQVSDAMSPESLFSIAPSFIGYAGFGLSDLESFIATYHLPQRSKSRFQIGILYYPEGQMEGIPL